MHNNAKIARKENAKGQNPSRIHANARQQKDSLYRGQKKRDLSRKPELITKPTRAHRHKANSTKTVL